MAKKKRKFLIKEHIAKILLGIIVIWLIGMLASNQIRAAMVQTQEVKAVMHEHVERGYGLVHGKETLVIAMADGAVEPVVPEGERVRKGNAVLKIGDSYSYTNVAGRVSYQLDGLEDTHDLNAICCTDLATRYEKQQETQNDNSATYVAGEGAAKVINTFDNIYLYVTIPRSTFSSGLEPDQSIPVRLTDLDEQMRATIVEVLDTPDGFRYLKLKLGDVKETIFQQRIYQVEILYDQSYAISIAPSALVEKDGKTGVYYLQKGFVFWREVALGAVWEETGDVMIESGLETGDIIVTTPQLVHEGENIKF